MKKLLFILALCSASCVWGDSNISQLTSTATPSGSDLLYDGAWTGSTYVDRSISINNLFNNLGPAYFISNQSTLQAGSVFNVSSASVQGPLLLNYTGSNDNGNFPGTPLFIVGSTNTYLQMVMQNLNPGSAASTDFIATSDQGNNNQDYVDMGINSSQYSQSGFSAVPSTWAYLYSSDHGLFIGADTNNSDSTSALEFGVAGQNMSNVEMEILNDGAIVHIGSTTFLGNISLSSGVFDGSNSAGTSGQVLTSRGPGTSPTWQVSGGSSGGLVSLSTGVTGRLPNTNVSFTYPLNPIGNDVKLLSPGTSYYATIDNSTNTASPSAYFVPGSTQTLIFYGVLAPYGGGNLTVDLNFSGSTVTANNVTWDVSIYCTGPTHSISADNVLNGWSVGVSTAGVVPSTAGYVGRLSGVLTGAALNSCVENDEFYAVVELDPASTISAGAQVRLFSSRIHEN